MRTTILFGLMAIAVAQADFTPESYTLFWTIFFACAIMDVVEFWKTIIKSS